ncbi:4-alpha-glucanotransferase [Parabacteroides pacaensis]|uniref:4-alpha-glucanotransferase n=1 Tax=Parabacteroides pacaensis TaxID=2086575 RepID=UPI000D0F66BE|nr:4-alpha-glucanotransferase [Parabacteroides pacaensis]
MKVTFNINFHTIWGQKLCVVGSIPELGLWNPSFAREMQYVGDGNWQLKLDLPSDIKVFEYRYFIRANDKLLFEEWEKNHRITFDDAAEQYTLYDYWQVPPANLAFYTSAFTKSWFAHPCDKFERVVKSSQHLVIKLSAPRIGNDQSVAIVGNQECIGNWDPKKAVMMSCDRFPDWQVVLDSTQINYPLEYKFLICQSDNRQPAYWESGENRVLNLPAQENKETVTISGLCFRDELPNWRCAGTVIPVFSLRSKESFGVGDLADLYKLIDWAKKTQQRIIQVLPMNDTILTHTWLDSYPYRALSIFALHPMYISLKWLGKLGNPVLNARFEQWQKELNKEKTVLYEEVVKHKLAYCREFYKEKGAEILASKEYKSFFDENKDWLVPYAAFSYLRDTYHTPDFNQWGEYAVYDANKINKLCTEESEIYDDIAFSYFLQYLLHKQFKKVSDYAHSHGIVLKGDIPIGISRTSVEAWTEPKYFNMNGQAGAPPDDFSATGQNWFFPTYNWSEMEKDNLLWWKKRFKKLSDYFDAFRIDHILGFFRIWEIPLEYVQGLCGHFSPALPLSKEEIEQYGLSFNEKRFTTPLIHVKYLPEIFGVYANEVQNTYLLQSSPHHYILNPICNTQRKIEILFEGKTDEKSKVIKNGLLTIANEVLFLLDPKEKRKFHPRISASQSYMYKELDNSEQYAFDQLYWHFFYHRHNDFWKNQALKRLTPLVNSTDMLVCGEDLGMIPDSVPDVMKKLQIFSLEIERMPKTPQREFTDLRSLSYHSVCTTSTHDMSTIRSWWKEDPGKTQRYYNNILEREGQAPSECNADIAFQIISNHLNAPSMLTIIPLQDWLALDDRLKYPDAEAERINVPSDPQHYWRYRIHINLENLMEADQLNEKISSLIIASGRK